MIFLFSSSFFVKLNSVKSFIKLKHRSKYVIHHIDWGSIFLFLPILSLFLNIIAWLHYGIDLPFWDDWVTYQSASLGSFRLSDLFIARNDTLTPVQYALDAIAFRCLEGNAIAYQFISMIGVCGLLLFLQWKLLSKVLKDRLLVASAFTLTLLMLQPGSYWGLQNDAYIQAMPLVFCFIIIYSVLYGVWVGWWRIFGLLILGLLAGFSYISGAFAVLVLGAVFLLLGQFFPSYEKQKQLRTSGVAIFVAGLISSIAQASVLIFIQHGTHLPNVSMALPIEPDFWIFMIGKVARSLILPGGNGALYSLILTILVIVYVFLLFVFFIKDLFKEDHCSLSRAESTLIYTGICSIIFIYLVLVSAGRTHLFIAESQPILQVFTLGQGGFYFFWVTLLWPWVVGLTYQIIGKVHYDLHRVVAIIFPFLVILWMICSGGMSYSTYYKAVTERRVDGLSCLVNHRQKNEKIDCPQIYPQALDSSLYQGELAGASFMRIIPHAYGPIVLWSTIHARAE